MNRRLDYTGHNLVFIVGSPRSGTTWLQRLLASHPLIKTGQESKVFRAYLSPQLKSWRWEFLRENNSETATGRGGTGLSCYFEEEDFLRILRSYMLQLLEPMIGDLRPGELFVEKTPGHAFCIAEIKELLPESKIIHVLRDGRDVVASLLAAARSWGAGWAPRRPEKAAATWVRHVQAVREAAKNLPAGELHEIKYEQLWSSPEGTLREVSRYLELDWSDEQIRQAVKINQPEAVKDGKGTVIPIRGEVGKRIGSVVKDPQSFIRKAQPRAWKTDLSFKEKLIVWHVARKTMHEVGYPWT